MTLFAHTSRWLLLLCFGWMLFQGMGCSSDEPRYPEDHARFKKIDQSIETLREGYVQRDLSSIQRLMLPVDRIRSLEEAIRTDFETFQEIELDLSVDRIMIDGQTIDVFIHWLGKWKRKPADAWSRERGHGMLRWVGTRSILLQDVEGDLPFGMAGRQPTSVSRPALAP